MASLLKLARAAVSSQVRSSPSATFRLLTQPAVLGLNQQAASAVPRSFLAIQHTRWHHCEAQVQRPAPDFKGMAVVNGQFKELSLGDFAGKYLVLFFYPLDFTFVCPTEVIAFNDRADEFKALNTELVAVSVDSHFSHLAWVNTARKNGGLGTETKIPILSDLKKSISAAYGCLTPNEDIALRALYIIDAKGVIRQITINDLPVGRSVDEVLRLVRAFQYVDEHGEVCPANWQPKSKTINPKKASEYFASQFSS